MNPTPSAVSRSAHRRLPRARCAWAVSLALATLGGNALAKAQPQGQLGLGLAEVMALQARQAALPAADMAALLKRTPGRTGLAVLDAQGRVRVDVHLNGRAPLDSVRQAAERLGARTVASTTRYRHGAMTLFLPSAQAARLAAVPGVKSVLLSPDAVADVGTVTAESTLVMKSQRVNDDLGVKGAGITVGALSDSYDVATFTTIRAATDVASGDLPGTGNPNGYTQPVVVVEDITSGSDEGRAMLQIVHDVAPAAKLCFATAFTGQIGFADNIRRLADKSGPCGADVIVDDIIYFAEPMFSDGVIAQAVDEVAAQGVSYFSSAGNRGATMGYLKPFKGVSNAVARGGSNSVNLGLIPSSDSPGGFHNHAKGATSIDVSRTITFGATSTLVLQWNDPFDRGAVTTDYDLYVYNAAGTAIVASSADNNLATDQPVEAVQVPAGTYQIVVVRFDSATPEPVADQVRFVTFGSVVNGEYLEDDTPITFGHNSAAGGNGVAAVPWFQSYLPESFTSPGPSLMYFDAEGTRLARPQVREKPDFAAPDGVNTTFFIGDTFEDADSFPNFFGTSAAAPSAAAVAALVLEAAGGPGSVTPAAMKDILKASAAPHDLAPGKTTAKASAGPATVKVTGRGDGQSPSSFNPDAFTVLLEAPAGYTLSSLTIDLSTANPRRLFLGNPAPGMQFDPRAPTVGQPLVLGSLKSLAPADVSFSPLSTVAPFSQQLTISLAPGSFTSASQLRFGVDRDEVATGGGGNSMDLLDGGSISGTVTGPGGESLPFSGRFTTPRQVGYSPLDGAGLINAYQAVRKLPVPGARR